VVLLPLLLLACRSTSEPVSTPEPRPTTPAPVPVTTPVPTPVPTTTPTPTGDGTLSSLDVGTPLTPPFDPELRYYWVRAADLGTEVVVDAEGDGDVEVFLETPEGVVLGTGPALSVEAGQRIRVAIGQGDGARSYSVAVLEDDLPLPTVVGAPSEGWTFITSTCWTEADIPNAALVVDGNGTPGWWRRMAKKGFDVRVAPDGRITWMGRTEELPTTLQNLVLGPDGGYDAALGASDPLPEWIAPQVDEHEWFLLDDGTGIRILNYKVMEDLSPWGGPKSQRVEHQVAQQVDLDGNVLFEVSTQGMVDYDQLPPNLADDMPNEDWEPVHINSIDVDPADGHWVMSLHRVSAVVKVARTGPMAGQVLWQLGGWEGSDFAFVDDPRDGDWRGFGGQHSVRVTGPDRIEMFDNANGDQRERGDVRIAEYQLDHDAGEASLVWSHDFVGYGRAFAGGSAQSLANGHHLVGFGSLVTNAREERVPTVTELDVDGQEIWNLLLPEGCWTYRAWRFEGDPMSGWNP